MARVIDHEAYNTEDDSQKGNSSRNDGQQFLAFKVEYQKDNSKNESKNS